MRALYADNLKEQFDALSQVNSYNPSPYNRYALALTALRLNRLQHAEQLTNELIAEYPDSLFPPLLAAAINGAANQWDTAAAQLFELHQDFPENFAILDQYHATLLQTGDHTIAANALENYLLSVSRPNNKAYKYLAEHQRAQGHRVDSRLSLAEFHINRDEIDAAVEQLKLALKSPDIDPDQVKRVQAWIDDLKAQRQRQQQ